MHPAPLPPQAPASSGSPRATVVACLLSIAFLALWRALARVGYRAPLVSVAGLLRSKRRRRWEEAAALHERVSGGGGAEEGAWEEEPPSPGGFGSTPPRKSAASSESLPDAFAADDVALLAGVLDTSDRRGLARPAAGTPPSPVQARAAAQRAARQERNRLQRLLETSAVESRWWQWCGFLGVLAQVRRGRALAVCRWRR